MKNFKNSQFQNLTNMKIHSIIILIFCLSVQGFSQSSIDDVLQSVKTNNKQLQVSKHYVEASKLSTKTGIYPENPKIGYISKFGNSDNRNIQELSITQGFEFPTVYFLQNNRSNLMQEQTEMQYKSDELELLFTTRIICLNLIYLNKRKNILQRRLNNTKENILMLEQKQELGASNILEINKAKILMLTCKLNTI